MELGRWWLGPGFDSGGAERWLDSGHGLFFMGRRAPGIESLLLCMLPKYLTTEERSKVE